MQDEKDMPDQIPELVRDAAFVRIGADRAVAFFLGRDLEVALTTFTPNIRPVDDPHTFSSEPTQVGFQADMHIVEVARLRMSPDGALGMALSIVDQLVNAGLIDRERLKDFLDQMTGGQADTLKATEPNQ